MLGENPLKNYRNIIGKIEEEFKELIDKVSEDKGGKPVIIFLDDLDRCSPEATIQLLEALKNLFVVSDCKTIFICGIDTHIAKKFISRHYDGLDEIFSIIYFRKIFNLTISMPYSPHIGKLLEKHIKGLYEWDDPKNEKAELLATLLQTRGDKAKIHSIREYLNIVTNFYLFLKFNPEYVFPSINKGKKNDDFIVNLLILIEAWHPLYEKLITESLRKPSADMKELTDSLIKQDEKLPPERSEFLMNYLGENSPFAEEILSLWMTKYQTLA